MESSSSRQRSRTSGSQHSQQRWVSRNPPVDRYSGKPLLYKRDPGQGHPWFTMPEYEQRLPEAQLPNVHKVHGAHGISDDDPQT